MKRYVPILACVLLLAALVSLGYWSRSAPRPIELTVSFVGLTNNPQIGTPGARLGRLGDGQGWHGLFAITNRSPSHYLQIGINRFDRQVGDGWVEHGFLAEKLILDPMCPPGDGFLYAIPWLPGLSTNTPWRMVLWAKREPPKFLMWVNHRLGWGVFLANARQSVTSAVVVPAPVVIDGTKP